VEERRDQSVLITEYYTGNMGGFFAFSNIQLHLPEARGIFKKSKSRL